MSDFVKLSDVNGYEVAGMRVNMNLPEYFPEDRILIDANRIARLARIGGFGGVLLSAYNGDTTKTNVGIDGFDSDGTATSSGSASVQKTELGRSSWDGLDSPRSVSTYAYFRPQLNLGVNLDQVEENVVREIGGVRNPKLISKQFDMALKQGINSAARTNLIAGTYPGQKLDFVYFNSFAILFSKLSKDNSIFDMWNDLLAQNALGASVANVLRGMWRGEDRKDLRLSLVAGLQFDRFATVRGLTKAQKLVKANKN